MKAPKIRVETRAGDAIQASGWKIIPFSKAWIIQLPFFNSGIIWNRPVSVAITAPDGSERVIPVIDVTRQVIWTMAGALVAWAVVFQFTKRHSRKSQPSSDQL
jgi:hypothetical protein